MGSTVSSRPNHYEALGLSPAASEDEIIKAFGKAMSLFGAHSVAAAAQLSIAFETLRNPVKRRAYDESLGLTRKPQPMAPAAVSFRISARVLGSEPHVEQHVAEPAPAAVPVPEPFAEPPREPNVASFIASSLRDIARPIALDTSGKVPREPEPRAAPPIEPILGSDSAPEDDRPIEWQRPAIAVAGVLLAAGLIGALAGISVTGDEQGGQEEAAVTAPLPPAKARANATAPAATAPAAAIAVPVETRAPRTLAAERPAERPTRAQPAWTAVQGADDGTAEASPSEQAAADPLAPQPEAAADAVAADLPLAKSTIARTIQRIGYKCGAVSSAAAVDGSPGVFTVTCASGDTYRAAPVHGRYRFHRMSKQ